MSTTLEKLSPWLFTIGLFVLWELACRIFNVDTFVLPAPSQIFEAAIRYGFAVKGPAAGGQRVV